MTGDLLLSSWLYQLKMPTVHFTSLKVNVEIFLMSLFTIVYSQVIACEIHFEGICDMFEQ